MPEEKENRTPSEASLLLRAWSQGDEEALERLTPLVYRELRALAAHRIRRERAGHSLEPTALVNEAFVRLIGQERVAWQNRSHFFAVAAQAMRRVLVDHARRRAAAKRGSDAARVTLDEAEIAAEVDRGGQVDVLELDAALHRLQHLDPRQTRVVELRFFGGLTTNEVAEALAVSVSTVEREWRTAKIWLRRELAHIREGQ